MQNEKYSKAQDDLHAWASSVWPHGSNSEKRHHSEAGAGKEKDLPGEAGML
jgi:hypothetical protein